MKKSKNKSTPLTAEEKAKKTRTTIIVISVIVAYVFLAAAVTVYIDNRSVDLKVKGDKQVVLEYGMNYEDAGAELISSGRIFGEKKLDADIHARGSVDCTKLGSYEISYSAHHLFNDYRGKRSITIVDTVAPEITLVSSGEDKVGWLTEYVEEGFSAIDNYDGDITDRVVRVENEDIITYSVSDSSGNTTSVDREVPKPSGVPEIKLLGDEYTSFSSCMYYSDPGFVAVDHEGNDVSASVEVSGEVIPYIPGTYTITYTLTSELGEVISKTRTVEVTPVYTGDYTIPSDKSIYLTFDDGPGPYTAELLDILARYNVKATFFVTEQMPEYEYLIAREAREGHAVGVHTYAHDYYYIYSSEEAYFEDFNAMEEIIFNQTGSYSNIFRFPGGSSNTISNFNPGIMSRLTVAMENLGYKYFDWNVVSGDAGETTKTAVVVQNVIDGCSVHTCNVVLQHDIWDFSVDAVEDIIIWGLNNGYTFKTLSENGPGAHHGVNN